MFNFKKILVAIFLIFSIAYVGAMDVAHEESEFVNYCIDLSDGVHPDFKNLIDKCEELNHIK